MNTGVVFVAVYYFVLWRLFLMSISTKHHQHPDTCTTESRTGLAKLRILLLTMRLFNQGGHFVRMDSSAQPTAKIIQLGGHAGGWQCEHGF
ncbi:uncharacterized protein BCR38DRAFT_434166 [Pseudomassariella vexata]|uniref:Uncharacterized protein n=1 Tax=Pseudomassariella vexata TaxID=1141098 RepID=A0A1Y2DXW6_9PEZI|nr:uncharacterized protein BCR38DRAFT_434166 [Pseudomassariella vexata]ORY64148.1 hypothetical protein BCR38DRAFT_434166 [Pseudomassariella vexata]